MYDLFFCWGDSSQFSANSINSDELRDVCENFYNFFKSAGLLLNFWYCHLITTRIFNALLLLNIINDYTKLITFFRPLLLYSLHWERFFKASYFNQTSAFLFCALEALNLYNCHNSTYCRQRKTTSFCLYNRLLDIWVFNLSLNTLAVLFSAIVFCVLSFF
jgi:hypothetical protein